MALLNSSIFAAAILIFTVSAHAVEVSNDALDSVEILESVEVKSTEAPKPTDAQKTTETPKPIEPETPKPIPKPIEVPGPKVIVLEALEYNPEVQAKWHEFQASIQDISIARAGYLPTADISATAGKVDRDFDGRDKYPTRQVELTLSQSLFQGFRTQGRMEQFSSANQVRYLELLDSIETTALEATKAYQDVLRYRALVSLANDNFTKHKEVFTQIENRTRSGVGRGVDLEQVAGRLALAETNLMTETANLHDVSARFLRVVGKTPPQTLNAMNLEAIKIPRTREDALQMALQGNPGFHAAIKNISAAQAVVKVERSGYYPKAEIRARQVKSLNNNGFDERVDPSSRGKESAIELALTYNLFSGLANRAAIRRSLDEVNIAKDLRDQACGDLRQVTQIAFNDISRLNAQLVPLQQHKLSSNKVRSAYAAQFAIGQRTLLDLLDAENEYFQASRAYATAQSDLVIAKLRTMAAFGKLLPTVGLVTGEVTFLRDNELNTDVQVTSAACPRDIPDVSRPEPTP
jgi:outer membrane protein, adhesin transport system